ncbi:MAG: hypothetical protein LRY43_01540 [Gammaproteobacteria bacterium]|nr:hypothetical protein [Gammaproteobacteria bacterium]
MLNVYGRIIQQKMDEKRSFQLDEDTQTEANKIFESWLEEWEKFFTHQSPENAQKLQTFVECGIPHSVQDKLVHAHQQRQEEAKAKQRQREQEAENVKQVLKLQALENPQYSNPYVEAIFRGMSEDSDRSFFVFNEYSATFNEISQCSFQ